MKSTNIGIISDIHFGKDSATKELCVPGNNVSCHIEGAAPYIESCISVLKTNSIEYLIVSGDLTSFATPEEFIYCEEVIANIATECGIPISNVLYCLGNHDVNWAISGLYKQNSQEIGQDLLKIRKDAYQKVALYAPYCYLEKLPSMEKKGPNAFCGIYDRDDLVVFVLNTNTDISEEQSKDRYSHGVIGDEQLKWFKEKALQYKTSNKTKILLMHHHPYNYRYPLPAEDISTIKEGPEILDIAGQAEVDYIIHGHRHHPFAKVVKTNDYAKPISIICAGSFGVKPQERLEGNIPNMMHVLKIEDRIGHLYNYKYNVQNGWIRIDDNSDSTIGIESEVFLGKSINEDDIRIQLIEYVKNKLPENRAVVLDWRNTIEDLKFLTCCRANKICSEIAKEMQLTSAGKFPDKVYLLKDEK